MDKDIKEIAEELGKHFMRLKRERWFMSTHIEDRVLLLVQYVLNPPVPDKEKQEEGVLDYRKRLSLNAEDFDQIISEMLSELEECRRTRAAAPTLSSEAKAAIEKAASTGSLRDLLQALQPHASAIPRSKD